MKEERSFQLYHLLLVINHNEQVDLINDDVEKKTDNPDLTDFGHEMFWSE